MRVWQARNGRVSVRKNIRVQGDKAMRSPGDRVERNGNLGGDIICLEFCEKVRVCQRRKEDE